MLLPWRILAFSKENCSQKLWEAPSCRVCSAHGGFWLLARKTVPKSSGRLPTAPDGSIATRRTQLILLSQTRFWDCALPKHTHEERRPPPLWSLPGKQHVCWFSFWRPQPGFQTRAPHHQTLPRTIIFTPHNISQSHPQQKQLQHLLFLRFSCEVLVVFGPSRNYPWANLDARKLQSPIVSYTGRWLLMGLGSLS